MSSESPIRKDTNQNANSDIFTCDIILSRQPTIKALIKLASRLIFVCVVCVYVKQKDNAADQRLCFHHYIVQFLYVLNQKLLAINLVSVGPGRKP